MTAVKIGVDRALHRRRYLLCSPLGLESRSWAISKKRMGPARHSGTRLGGLPDVPPVQGTPTRGAYSISKGSSVDTVGRIHTTELLAGAASGSQETVRASKQR